MHRSINIIAAVGLALGGALGLAGAMVTQQNVQAMLWAIDGAALVMAAAMLATKYFRTGNDVVAGGFLVFAIGEGVILLSGPAAGLAGSVPAFAAGTSLWGTALLLVSVPKLFAMPIRILGIVSAVLFIVTAARIFWGEQLQPTSTPLPTYAYPVLVATFVGWIWTLLGGRRMHHVKRRDFIALLGSAATIWPLAVRAQQQPVANMPVVTLVNARRADAAIAFIAEFRKGLSQTGLTEGRDLAVEYHWLDGHYEELPAIISDAVRRHVAVIATPASTPGSLAAKAATSAIPIVFGVGEDPAALGLVASLAQPGANATGINFFASEIDSKRLGLMHELLPKARRLAVLVNHANPITAEATTRALNDAAPGLGLQLLFFKASTAAEIDAAFAAFADARADALFIAPDGFFASRHLQLATLATRGAAGMTKEAALPLFNSVPVTISTICRISFVCAQARIEAE